MRIRVVLILAMVLTSAGFVTPATAGTGPADLTANELAQVLGIQWWIFSVPADAKRGDTISVHWVTPSGRGTGSGLGVEKPGEQVKIFYWMDESTHQPMVKIVAGYEVASGDANLPDGFVIGAASGIANGFVVNSGDLLVKLEKRVPGLSDYSSDSSTTLKPNEIGLKVEIEKKALAAAP